MRNRSDAMPVEVLAFFCCFRSDFGRALERSGASRLMFSGSLQAARVGQARATSGWLRYAAFERLDLLYLSIDHPFVALISGSLVAGVLVAGVLVP